jgi:hypothetical protein
MSLEELLADSDVLHGDDSVARVELRDRIEEIRRVAVIDAPEKPGNVQP